MKRDDRANDHARLRQLLHVGDLAAAEALARALADADPDDAEAIHLRGVVAGRAGRSDEAIVHVTRAIALAPAPGRAAYHHHLGEIYRAAGRERLSEAIEALRRAVAIDPQYARAHASLGAALLEAGDAAGARDACRRAVALDGRRAKTHHNLGAALLALDAPADAAAAFAEAVRLDASYARPVLGLGAALLKLGRAQAALIAYRRAAAMDPANADAPAGAGRALTDLGRLPEALQAFEAALAIERSARRLGDVGQTLRLLDRLDDALAAYRAALEMAPNDAWAHNGCGGVLVDMGRLDAAAAEQERALAIDPHNPEGRLGLAWVAHLRGDLAEGFRHLAEWTDRRPATPSRRTYPQPPWQGEPLDGRTLLIHTDFGVGDKIQFARYATLIAQQHRAARVILEAGTDLAAVLASIDGVTRVISPGEACEADFQTSLMRLPVLFGTTLDTIPARVPYVTPDAARVARWEDAIPGEAAGTTRVGVVWAGNPKHHNDFRRSMCFADIAPLAQVPGVRMYALQKGPAAQQLRAAPAAAGVNITDFGPRLATYADTAAVIADLDLVITVDTSVAHLAGALGRPVWVMLAHAPDWRWLRDRTDSPWYPTMRLFRQPAPGTGWSPVIAEVAAALRGGGGDRGGPR